MSAKIHTGEFLRVLREKAEQLVQQQVDPSALSDEIDFKRLTHELEAQYVELQLQNEELHRITQELTASRKQGEQYQQESEERFRTMADGLPLIVWVHDAEGRQQFVNQTFLEFFGVTSGEIQGERWQQLLHPDDAQAYTNDFITCARQRRPFHACARVRRADRQWRWIESWGRPRLSSAGDFLGYVGTSADITARKQADEELNTAIQFLSLVNASKHPQELIKAAIDFICQKSGCDAVGIRLPRGPGYPYVETRGFSDAFSKKNALCMLGQQGQVYCDSSDHRVSACMCANVIYGHFDPGRPCFTEKGTFWTNSTTELSAPNPAADCQRLVCSRCNREGYESMALIQLRSGTEPLGLLQLNDRRRDHFSLQAITLWERLSDYLSVGLSKLAAEEDLRRMNTTLEQMVSERTRLAEARAKQLQSLAVELIETEERERRQFAHLLHDDLQQLLAAAKMQLQALSDHHPNRSDLAPVEQIIGDCIVKSRRLSQELSPPVLRHSGLVPSLQWLAHRMGEQFDLAVELETNLEVRHENTPLKTFLFRAVQELLFNVVKHAGVLRARVALSGTESHLSVAVSDQGKGFDHDLLNAANAGFGLMSIQERARYMGGSLAIDSAPGQGSHFVLVVPLGVLNDHVASKPFNSAKPKRRISDGPAASGSGGTRVLFADDHHVMRQGLINLISGQPGIQVVGEAGSGREAIDQARHLRPNVVVMDVSMPEMDGVEATRRIKAEWPEVRVIGLSMYEDDHVKQAMRQAGAEILLSKTASMPELLKAIYGIGREEIARPEET